MFMAVLLAFSGLIGIGAATAMAAGERSEIDMISFPRGADANLSGWHMDAYDMFAIFCVGS